MFRISARPHAAGFLGLTVVLMLPALASAQITPASGFTPPDDTQAIKVGAVIYYDYTYTKQPLSTDADGNPFHPSAFNVGRAYLNITGNVSHLVAFRITPDITRDTDAASALTGNLVFRVKYAFAQFNLDEWSGDWKGTWARAGIQQTPYIDFMEGIYRYRFQGTIFEERDAVGGNLTSSDTGVSFHAGLPGNYGDVHVGVYNGEGYSKAEVNGQKAVQVRGTVRPFATSSSLTARGLRLTLFYDGDHYAPNAERTRFVANATFEHRRFNAGVDYLIGHDQAAAAAANVESKGWSLWATPFFKEKGNGPEALFRVDRFRPNAAAAPAQERQRLIAGLAYWFPHPGGGSTSAVLLDFEQLKFDGTPAAPATATQQRIALHGVINF